MKLNLRRRGVAIDARENASLVDADSHRPAACEHVIEAHPQRAPPAREIVVGRDRLRALEDDSRLQVVLEVFADAGKIVNDANAKIFEQASRAHPGELEQLRRLERAGAQQNLASRGRRVFGIALTESDSGRASTL